MANIMILEDEQYLRRLYTEELEREGHQVIVVGQGSEALRILQQIPIDLVILDLVVGGDDGLDWLQKMMVLRRDLKVVINTAYPEFRQDFRCWGADRFVIKSSDLSALKATVKELLEAPLCTARIAISQQPRSNLLLHPPA
ncbi:MAG: response regulator [candidate division KSB1 bacterium]|nr:response regulator [candidate division KSB1 bacterium]MDZ7303031.1 response regulator [candidate division KSB1 bacterium]MDZ7312461.1 response regulator [candidate division KSB1 bacterium]